MSREKKIKCLMIACGSVLLAAVVLAVSGIFGAAGGYADAERYTAGEADLTQPVRNLEIAWIDGTVRIETHAENTVTIRETSKKPIPEDRAVRWFLDGDTLRIQYEKSGLRVNLTGLQKELTVTLPEGTELDKVSVAATSGDIRMPGLKARTVTVNTTSGDTEATLLSAADSVQAASTSGDITLRAGEVKALSVTATSGNAAAEVGSAETVTAVSTSGGVRITGERAGSLSANCTSGTVEIRVREAGEARVNTTSGTVRFAAGKLNSLEIGATSGDLTAELPQEPGFTAEVKSLSGDVRSGLALTKDGNRYTCGDGSAKVQIHTTSGDIELNAWQD